MYIFSAKSEKNEEKDLRVYSALPIATRVTVEQHSHVLGSTTGVLEKGGHKFLLNYMNKRASNYQFNDLATEIQKVSNIYIG